VCSNKDLSFHCYVTMTPVMHVGIMQQTNLKSDDVLGFGNVSIGQ
jgi:hypothetical protein